MIQNLLAINFYNSITLFDYISKITFISCNLIGLLKGNRKRVVGVEPLLGVRLDLISFGSLYPLGEECVTFNHLWLAKISGENLLTIEVSTMRIG